MRLWWTTALAALVACGNGGTEPKDSAAPGTDTATTTDTGDPTDEEKTARLSGTVSSASGPVDGVNIRFCRGTACRYYTTEADGKYAFDDADVAWHSLELVPPEGSGLATAFAPIELGSHEDRVIDVTVPALDPAVPLGAPKELELGSGLLVTVGADDLEPPLFVDPATHAAGVQVPSDLWMPVDRDGGTVLAVWYTSPFDHHAIDPGGLPLRIENQWALPEGSTYAIWVGSYTDSTWLDAGTVTVGSDGYLSGDAALPLLSTVLLVETP